MSSGDSRAADASPRGPSAAEAAFTVHRPHVSWLSHIITHTISGNEGFLIGPIQGQSSQSMSAFIQSLPQTVCLGSVKPHNSDVGSDSPLRRVDAEAPSRANSPFNRPAPSPTWVSSHSSACPASFLCPWPPQSLSAALLATAACQIDNRWTPAAARYITVSVAAAPNTPH